MVKRETSSKLATRRGKHTSPPQSPKKTKRIRKETRKKPSPNIYRKRQAGLTKERRESGRRAQALKKQGKKLIDKGEIIKGLSKFAERYNKKGDVGRRIAYRKAIGAIQHSKSPI